jgi:peptidoglycan/xylan/chitin deacetylase (PgdA/CDA1 family)
MGAYGVSTAMPRILKLHDSLEIPGSFFIPGYVAEMHPELVKEVSKRGYEVAHHGYMHENVFLLDDKEEKEVFYRAHEILKKLTGKYPVGWSAPGWGVKEHTLNLLKELDMLYDSSLMEYDMPYSIYVDKGRLIELPISLILDDYGLFGGSLYPNGGGVNSPAATAYQIWQEEFEGMRRFGGLFTTTFHPMLMGRPGRMNMLYDLCAYMRQYDDVWWGTYEDVAQYVNSMIE